MLQMWFTFQTKCHFKPLKNDDKKKCYRCGLPFKANHISNHKRTVIKRNTTDVVYLSNQITFWTIKERWYKEMLQMWFTFQGKSHFKPWKNGDKKKCYRCGLPFKPNPISNNKRTVIKRNASDVVYLLNQATFQTIKERR